MKVWRFLLEKLENKQRAVLLYVLDSQSSSPGRKGFKMAIADDGRFEGTIGGGIMEVKLLELAKNKLKKKDTEVLIKRQYHDKRHTTNQSGMICSGEQTVAIIPLSDKDRSKIQTIIHKRGQAITIGLLKTGMALIEEDQGGGKTGLETENYLAFLSLKPQKRVHIFGGGHVGLALSNLLSLLGFYVIVYDDRPGLNTLEQNRYADEIHVIDYNAAALSCDFKPEDAVVIVTFSYRTDKVLLKQLYQKTFFYIGMMGSDAKIATLYRELEKEGISPEQLKHVFAPIGLEMYSKTAMEIALSIAGQIILQHNKNLPTGRRY